jgi:GNAT superfamily N-acetyltransferase
MEILIIRYRLPSIMDAFTLKDGRVARIAIWGIDEIAEFASRDIPTYDLNNMGDKAFLGFAYLGPSLPEDLRRVDPDHDYARASNLSPMEVQPDGGLPKEMYHRMVTASVDGKLAGIRVCQWTHFGRFWSYHGRWVDVHEDYRNLGIGTGLVRAVDQADFLKDKILRIGMFSPLGGMYMKNVLQRELKALDYAVVYGDYDGPAPQTPGVYGGRFID